VAIVLATFPITAMYFHQFPTYFMISNVIAIPGAFLIMAWGIPFLLFSVFEPVGGLMGAGLNELVRVFNFLIFNVQDIPFSKVEAIHITSAELVTYYLLLLLLYSLYFYPEKKKLYAGMAIVLVGVAFNWLSLVNGPDEVVIYSMQKGKAVDYFRGGSVYGWHEEVNADDLSFKVQPYRLARGVKPKNQFVAPPEISGKLSLDLTNLPVRKAMRYADGRWDEMDFAEIDWEEKHAYKLILGNSSQNSPPEPLSER
jgi:competence protein ComEC